MLLDAGPANARHPSSPDPHPFGISVLIEFFHFKSLCFEFSLYPLTSTYHQIQKGLASGGSWSRWMIGWMGGGKMIFLFRKWLLQ